MFAISLRRQNAIGNDTHQSEPISVLVPLCLPEVGALVAGHLDEKLLDFSPRR
jgi:hypothetical protein